MEEWKEYKAMEFCSGVTDGTHDSPKPQMTGRYLITSKHLKDNRIDFSSANQISEDDYRKIILRSAVEQYDILFSMIGTIGNTVQVKQELVDFAVKNMGIFKMGRNHLKSTWLYYWLNSINSKLYINQRLAGSTQSYLTLDSLRNFPILYPGDDKANSIVSILKSLDDKIECNRRINENLEQQAQALFKSWFVDFEPFKDQPFVESELGMIPQGWRVGRYEDIIDSTISGDWGKEKAEGNYTHKVACIRGCDFQDIKNGLRGKTPERYILEKNYQTKHFKDKDVLVEISGGTATVSTGRVCPVSQLLIDKYDGDIVCTNFCRLVRPKDHYGAYLYYSWLFKYSNKVMFGYENGTSGIKNFRIKDFVSLEPIIIPSEDSLIRFQSFINQLQIKLQMNGSEIQKLAELRDTLLPKLMSGELNVENVNF